MCMMACPSAITTMPRPTDRYALRNPAGSPSKAHAPFLTTECASILSISFATGTVARRSSRSAARSATTSWKTIGRSDPESIAPSVTPCGLRSHSTKLNSRRRRKAVSILIPRPILGPPNAERSSSSKPSTGWHFDSIFEAFFLLFFSCNTHSSLRRFACIRLYRLTPSVLSHSHSLAHGLYAPFVVQTSRVTSLRLRWILAVLCFFLFISTFLYIPHLGRTSFFYFRYWLRHLVIHLHLRYLPYGSELMKLPKCIVLISAHLLCK